MEEAKGSGIINGIDSLVWNPEIDPMIFKTYSIDSVEEGKKENKKLLCKKFGLSSTEPLIVFIGRLVGEKGADLLPEAIESCINTYKGKLNFLILGSGDSKTEKELKNLSAKYKKQYGVYIGYNEVLSHRIYAGADFLIMPSRVEPCGLNQLYAMRYGTIPIVNNTGGLKDTVIDLKKKDGYGLCFDKLSTQTIEKVIGRAYELYKDSEKMLTIRKKMMLLNFSWDKSAEEYINLYKSLSND
jgi:starch synthase